jgi:hypothetical protein
MKKSKVKPYDHPSLLLGESFRLQHREGHSTGASNKKATICKKEYQEAKEAHRETFRVLQGGPI